MNNILEKYKGYRRLFPTVRVSWTAYLHWKSGRKERLFDYLLDREEPPTYQMRRGRVLHQAIEDLDTEVFKKLINTLFEDKITGIEREVKEVVELSDYEIPTVFSGVLDVLIETPRGHIVIDWKTGKSSLSWYEEQLRLYGLLLKMKGLNPVRGILVKFDDDLRITDLFEVEYGDFTEIESRFDAFVQDLHYSILIGELDEYLDKISRENQGV